MPLHAEKPSINDHLSLHDVTLMATDVHKLASFYKKIGFAPDENVNNENLVVFPMPSSELAIHKAKQNSAITISFKIKSIDLIINNLKRASIPYKEPEPLRPGLIGISFKDPNGNTVEFLSPAPKE